MPQKKKSIRKKAAVKKAAVKKVAKKTTKKGVKKAVKKAVKKIVKKVAKNAISETTVAAPNPSASEPVLSDTLREIPHHEIEVAAFFIYQQRASEGRWGNQFSDWLEAEQALRQAS